MPLVLEFAEPDREFLAQEVTGVLCAVAEHVVDTQNLRLVVEDHACVRCDGHLACGEFIKRIDGLVRRHVVRKVDHDVHLVCGEVVDLLDLDLTGLLGLEDCLDHHLSRLAVRHLGDCESILVDLLDLCADLDLAALALAAVFRAVGRTTCEEVREYLEILALKHADGCVYEFVEVVRENLGCITCTDTFCTLCKEDRELHRKFHGLLVTTVV